MSKEITPGVVVGLLIGTIAGLVAVYAAVVATYTYLRPYDNEKTLLRAFKALENDFEETEARVTAGLGRISRLKRDTVGLPTKDQIAAAAAMSQMVSQPRPRTRFELLKQARNYGTDETLNRPGEGRRTGESASQ